jgi:ATP-dependent exoDNAse (exonuclease V) alpha subunit
LLQSENGELVFGKKIREWQTIPFLRLQREEWGNIVNQYLEFHGHLDRISHLSHKARGIELIPGVHQGPANYIKSAELTQLNEEIVKENAAMIRDNPELIFQKLSINKPVFTPEDIAKVLSEVLYSRLELSEVAKEQGGVPIAFKSNDIEQLNAKYSTEFMVTYEQLLASKNITLINPCDLKGRKLYALTKRIELEQRYEQTVEQLADTHRHALNINADTIDHRTLTEELVEGIYALGREVQTIVNDKAGLELNLVAKEQPSLTTEQKQAVVEVLNGSDVSVLEGWPGAGKTHSMRAIVKQYQRAGYKVLGAAPSSAAALTLAKAAGIEAKNIAQWRKSWQEERGVKFELALRSDYYSEAEYQQQSGILAPKTVLIVDEASMVELANMDYLVNEVKKSGAKVVLVGDNNQFAAVGMTGAFKKAGNIAGRSRLTEIMRHQHLDPYIREQQRLATKLVGQYKIPQALAIYHELGVFKIESNAEETKAALVNDYVKEYLEQSDKRKRDDLAAMRSVVIGAYTNVAVNHFNIEVRERLKQAGVLKGTGAKFRCGQETVELFKGEQIVFETNKKARQGFNGVLNGEVATVIDFEQPDKYGHGVFKALVHKADGSKQLVKINTGEEKYPVRFKHGYAVTGYKLQGETVDHMRVYHEPVIGYEAFNVLMSRHKLDVKMYASQEVLEDIVYKRINEDTREAREKFNIKAYAKSLTQGEADKELPAWYVGLALASSKRVDNSFARDYRAGEVLSGNEQVIKSYLESRELLFNLQGKISEWKERHQQPLKLASLQQQLAKKFVITDAREIVINPNALIFTVNSKVITEAEGDRVKFSNLSKAEKNSAIWSVLKESSKEELTILFDELKQTRKELRGHADNICRHYNGWVDRELQSKLDGAEVNLEDKYLDIKSNWIKAQRNKLGNEVGEGVVNAIANEKTFDRALEVYRDLSKWREGQRSQGKSDSIITAPVELWGKDAQEKWINHLLLTFKESEVSETTECGITLATIKELESFEQEKKEALPGIQQLRASLNKAMEGVSSADSKSLLTMGDYMTQLNLNYETVQKHAELSPYKYYLEEIEASGAIGSNSNWQEMMKVSEVIIRVQDNRKLLPKAERDKQLLVLDTNLKAVSQFVYEIEHEILQKNEALKASINEHRVITLEVGKLEDYRNTLILEYFSRVYKAPANEVLDNWKSLVENNPQVMLSSIARQVKNNPSLLGELKGIGLGKMSSP